MKQGYIGLVLHGHLPFIRHPEYEHFLEENWLFEAITETYFPILRSLKRLDEDGLKINITISFSPTLLHMMSDELLSERYRQYLLQMIELGTKEVGRTYNEPEFQPLAQMYLDRYQLALDEYDNLYKGNILKGYGELYKKGQIEIITAPGTYPFLPFYQAFPENLHAQIEAAVTTHQSIFGVAPRGMWLPECGYFPGIEEYLQLHDLEYFYIASHGVLFADKVPKAGTYAPVETPNGMMAFPRDISSAHLIWSSKAGYPASHDYRDFYRDIGFDLPMEYIGPYLNTKGNRVYTGYKYYAITGDTVHKRPYNIDRARQRVTEHANNFVFHQAKHLETVAGYMDKPPVATCPYTAELFGHWWFEGPLWLEEVIRCANDHEELDTITAHGYMNQWKNVQKVQPIFSSWGNKGYGSTWLDGENDWVYRHIHYAIERMVDLAKRFPDETSLRRKALNQAAREVLLMQSMDWAYMMRSGNVAAYAEARVREHLANFHRIYDALSMGNLSTDWLSVIENRNNAFPNIDYEFFGRLAKYDSQTNGFQAPAIEDKFT